ncbi:MAG: hypothetical protein AAFP19_24545, partial [Bacteroidota bacterium]
MRQMEGDVDLKDPTRCPDNPRGTCRVQETYWADYILSSNALATLTNQFPIDLLASNEAVFAPYSLEEEDGRYWLLNKHTRGEVAWTVGHVIGPMPPGQVIDLNISVIGSFNPSGIAYVALHDGSKFVPINGGQNYITVDLFNNNDIPGVRPDTILTAEELYGLRLLVYKPSGTKSWTIDAIKIDIDYYGLCDPCSDGGPSCTEQERQAQANSLDVLRDAIDQFNPQSMSLPDTLYHLRFCDNEERYVLGQELSMIVGSYGILQEIPIDSITQSIKFFTGAGAQYLKVEELLPLRNQIDDLLIDGFGCPVSVGFEKAECTYTVEVKDQNSWQYENIPNSQEVLVSYDRVTTKSCEADTSQINQVTDSTLVTIYRSYGFVDTFYAGGYINTLVLNTRHQGINGTLPVMLHPNQVIGTYPELADSAFTAADFYYKPNDPYKFGIAINAAIQAAINQWQENNNHSQVLHYISAGIQGYSQSDGSGGLRIFTYHFHDPSIPYITIGDEGNDQLFYYTNGTSSKQRSAVNLSTHTGTFIEVADGTVPCAYTGITYTDQIIDEAASNWWTLALRTPNPPTISEQAPCDFGIVPVYSSSCTQPKRIWNGSEMEFCDYCEPDPPTCSSEEVDLQRTYLDSLKQTSTSQNMDDYIFPDSLHRVVLCDGTVVYLLGAELEGLPGPSVTTQSIPTTGGGQVIGINQEALGEAGSDTTKIFGMKLAYEPNGNVREAKWQVKYEPEQKYEYIYDDLDRIESASYSGFPDLNYNVTVEYEDARGNISHLLRMGNLGACTNGPIDDLYYSYDGNQVTSIEDRSGNPKGFTPGDIAPYLYDGNGNMDSDPNKGIDTIHYNFLNLPDRIIFEQGG